jgi:signal transduction histidine kinase
MSEIEAITQTLDKLMGVDLPRLIGLFGVLLILAIIVIVIVFWRISNNSTRADSQQWQLLATTMSNLNEYLRVEQSTNRAKLDLAVQEIRTGHEAVMKNYALQNVAIENLIKRFGELFTVIDGHLETMQERVTANEMRTQDQWHKMTETSQGLRKDMNEVKDGNQEILTELRELTAQVKRLADTMQQIDWEQFAAMPTNINSAMQSVTTTVNKLTQTQKAVGQKSELNTTQNNMENET